MLPLLALSGVLRIPTVREQTKMAPGKESGISAMSVWTNSQGLLISGQLRRLRNLCLLRNCALGAMDSSNPGKGVFVLQLHCTVKLLFESSHP